MNEDQDQDDVPNQDSGDDFGDTDECVPNQPTTNNYQTSQGQALTGQTPIADRGLFLNQQRVSATNLQVRPSAQKDGPMINQSASVNVMPNTQRDNSKGRGNNQNQYSNDKAFASASYLRPAEGGLQVEDTHNRNRSQAQMNSYQTDKNDPEHENNFQKAYLKLVEKVYSEQGANILISQEELDRVQYLSQINQKEFNERVKQSVDNKKEKTKMLEQIMKDQEMKECTFKPQLLSHRGKRKEEKPNRNLDQFLEDQFMYEQHKKEKAKERKQKMKQEKKQIYRKVPQVDKKSNTIVESKKDRSEREIPAHERLHNIHQEKIQKQVEKIQQKQHEIRKKAQISRQLKQARSEANLPQVKERDLEGKTVDQHLYELAQQKQEKLEAKKKYYEDEQNKKINDSRVPQGQQAKSLRYAKNKFFREYDAVTRGIFEEEEIEFGPNFKVNYLKFQQILIELGFLPSHGESGTKERELMYELWTLLDGEKNQGATINNIYKALLGVTGIDPDFDNPDAKYEVDQDEEKLGNFNSEGEFFFTVPDIKRVFVKYKPLYVHKVYKDGQTRKFKTQTTQKHDYKPQLSKKSDALAMKKRQRVFSDGEEPSEPKDDLIVNRPKTQNRDVYTILSNPKMNEKRKPQEPIVTKEEKELKECTFKPKTKTYKDPFNSQASQANQTTDALGNKIDKNTLLFQRARGKNDKKDKTKEDYEYEKYQNDCTFKPNLLNSQKSIGLFYNSRQDVDHPNPQAGPSQATQKIKGFQTTMERLQKGRDDRHNFKLATGRGIPGTEQDDSKMAAMKFTTQKHYKPSFDDYQMRNGSKSTYQANSKLASSKSQEGLEEHGRTQSKKRGRSAIGHRSKQPSQRAQESNSVSHGNEYDSRQERHEDGREQWEQSQPEQSQDQIVNLQVENNENEGGMILSSGEIPQGSPPKNDKQALLYVDVNLGPNKAERIIVYEGDTAIDLAQQFARKHNLDEGMQQKLTVLLDNQISGLLEKIEEESDAQ